MPQTYKVLGQSNPAAATPTDIYTVPAATQAIVSVMSVTNIGAAPAAVDVAVRPTGASLADEHYIAFTLPVAPGEIIELARGVSLGATDVITITADSADVAVSAFGVEIS